MKRQLFCVVSICAGGGGAPLEVQSVYHIIEPFPSLDLHHWQHMPGSL